MNKHNKGNFYWIKKEIRERTREPEPQTIKLSASIISAVESGQSTHQSASYSGTSQSAIGKTPKNPEISLSNGQENFSQPSSIPLTLEQYKFRPRSYLTEGEAEHEEEIKQLRHRPLPTSQPTQPAIQFSTISEPTAQEKAISHKKKSDARREWDLATQSKKPIRRSWIPSSSYINPPPRPVNSTTTYHNQEPPEKEKKSFWKKNETTAKIAKWTGIGAGTIAAAGGLYAGVACVVGFFKIKGAIALGTAGVKLTVATCFWAGAAPAVGITLGIIGAVAVIATIWYFGHKIYAAYNWTKEQAQEQVANLQKFAQEKSQVIREVVESNCPSDWSETAKQDAGKAAALTVEWGIYAVPIVSALFLIVLIKKILGLFWGKRRGRAIQIF